MKITRKQLRNIVLREFKETGQDFYDIFSDTPPPEEVQDRGGGGGRIHQIVFVGNDYNDPNSWRAIPVNMSILNAMTKAVDSFSRETQKSLYRYMGGIIVGTKDRPGLLRDDEKDIFNELGRLYREMLNDQFDTVPRSDIREYYAVFHPSFAAHGKGTPEGQEKALTFYQTIAGYTPNIELLSQYEYVMHIATTTF